MTLDVAMGGSTNTVLHILAAAQEGEIDFDLHDIDEISRRVPYLAEVAPNSDYYMDHVHRAGGIPAILGAGYGPSSLSPQTTVGSLSTRMSTTTGWPAVAKRRAASPGAPPTVSVRCRARFALTRRWPGQRTRARSGSCRTESGSVRARARTGPGRTPGAPAPRRPGWESARGGRGAVRG